MIGVLERRGRFLATILQDGARSGVPLSRRVTPRMEGRHPTASHRAWRGTSLCGSGSTAGSRLRGSASENRHGGAPRLSRSPRDGGSRVAGATEVESEAVGAPSTPHRGDGIAAVATDAGADAPVGPPADAKAKRTRRRRQTRAQQRVAGTKK